MKLIELIDIIIDTAKSMPNINYVAEGDIYELNSISPNYSVIYITQGQHTINENFSEFNFKVFYLDRLMSDNSNRRQIQSDSLLILNNLINKIQNDNEEIECSSLRFTTFTHKFSDNCAGAWCDVTFSVNNELGKCSY